MLINRGSYNEHLQVMIYVGVGGVEAPESSLHWESADGNCSTRSVNNQAANVEQVTSPLYILALAFSK